MMTVQIDLNSSEKSVEDRSASAFRSGAILLVGALLLCVFTAGSIALSGFQFDLAFIFSVLTSVVVVVILLLASMVYFAHYIATLVILKQMQYKLD